MFVESTLCMIIDYNNVCFHLVTIQSYNFKHIKKYISNLKCDCTKNHCLIHLYYHTCKKSKKKIDYSRQDHHVTINFCLFSSTFRFISFFTSFFQLFNSLLCTNCFIRSFLFFKQGILSSFLYFHFSSCTLSLFSSYNVTFCNVNVAFIMQVQLHL